VCADRIVCAGRREEGGDKRISEPSSRTGVLGVARCEGLTTLARLSQLGLFKKHKLLI
jgi:hypothetical protein